MSQKNIENKVPIYKLETTEEIMKYYIIILTMISTLIAGKLK